MIYDNNIKLLDVLGGDTSNYSTDYEVRKAILTSLGGDASKCNSIYEVDLEILRIYEEGGGGGSSLPEQIKSIICNEDGTYIVTPDEGYTLSRVEIEVDATLPEQTKTVTYSENGSYTVTPDEGYTLSGANINVNVTNPAEVWKVTDGVKFKGSTFTSIPAGLDFSNVTNFGSMFYDCYNLRTVPLIDTSKGTNFISMFSNCSRLTEILQLDTSNGTSFDTMFRYCSNLKTITQLDLSSATTSINGMFNNCPVLDDVTFVGSINVSFSLEYVTSLNYNSVKSILIACSNTTKPITSKTLTFSKTLTDQNGELAALVADCNTKGWTISGLTLQ